MASAKKKQPTKSSGGTLSNMRSGFKRVAGTNGKKGKQPASFSQVFTWVIGIALLLVVIYLLARR
ncbi:MAG: hypothetical protein EP329_02420 [Deltaproteobacteria bacterium]|nr:MAG: hypothetical protein EP329_02420 [Deltaproteobacteria bacterium]